MHSLRPDSPAGAQGARITEGNGLQVLYFLRLVEQGTMHAPVAHTSQRSNVDTALVHKTTSCAQEQFGMHQGKPHISRASASLGLQFPLYSSTYS